MQNRAHPAGALPDSGWPCSLSPWGTEAQCSGCLQLEQVQLLFAASQLDYCHVVLEPQQPTEAAIYPGNLGVIALQDRVCIQRFDPCLAAAAVLQPALQLPNAL